MSNFVEILSATFEKNSATIMQTLAASFDIVNSHEHVKPFHRFTRRNWK